MNERPAIDRLRQAMRNASVDELEEALEAAEEERQRLLDAALADAIEMVNRHRNRLGRRVCSRPDGTVTRQVYELLRSMAGGDGGADHDPSFQRWRQPPTRQGNS